MKIRVKQGCSIQAFEEGFGMIWHDQGKEIDVPDASIYGDQVEILPDPKVEAPKVDPPKSDDPPTPSGRRGKSQDNQTEPPVNTSEGA